MKKISYFFAVLLISTLALSSCGGKKAKDLKVEDMKSACDFVDGMQVVMDEILALVGTAAGPDALSESQKGELKPLVDKLRELDEAAGKAYEKAEAEKCPNFKSLGEKGEKAESFF